MHNQVPSVPFVTLLCLRPDWQGVTEAGNDYGAYHPGCFLNSMVGTLLEIRFLASSVRTPGSRSAPYSIL